ncbi:unnamed protein product [Leptosia nina]|uniref:Secreted protein n=1 Tax=Leptosia nina TaxID=320188 RepID=A0AAV1JAB9_9NEOP
MQAVQLAAAVLAPYVVFVLVYLCCLRRPDPPRGRARSDVESPYWGGVEYNPQSHVGKSGCRKRRLNPTGGRVEEPVWLATTLPTRSPSLGSASGAVPRQCGSAAVAYFEVTLELLGRQIGATVVRGSSHCRTGAPGARSTRVAQISTFLGRFQSCVPIFVPLTEETHLGRGKSSKIG